MCKKSKRSHGMAYKRLSIFDVQKLYDSLYDRQERRIITSLTKWYDTNIINIRNDLIQLLNILPEVTEDNLDVLTQQILRLLDVTSGSRKFINDSVNRWEESDRLFINFYANDFKRDDALREDQTDDNGNPLLSAIAGTTLLNMRSELRRISELSTQTIQKDMTLGVLRGKRDGLTDEEAISKVVKYFKRPKTKSWKLTRVVRSNLTTFVGDRYDKMLQGNNLYSGKRWLTRNDEKVRDSHNLNQRQGVIGKEETFQNGQRFAGDREGVDITEWINCRCYVRGVK